MIAASGKGDVATRPRDQRPPARLLRLRDRRRGAQPHPDQGDAARRSAWPSGSAACRWARRRRPRPGPRVRSRSADTMPASAGANLRDRSHYGSAATRVRITFLGGLGEIGRNCAVHRGRRPHHAPRLRAHVPRRRHARRRPRPARLHLAARERRPHRRLHRSPTATRTTSAACRSCSGSCRSRSTARRSRSGLARNRIEEAGLLDRTELIPVADGERRQIGPFDCEFIPVTHSVPHGFATAFHTPQGMILHSGDFKLDLTPVDGRVTDLARIGAIADEPRASACCWPTPPTPRSPATRAQRARRRQGAPRPVPRPTPAGASSPPASPATSTASSRSPTPPSPTAARSPPSAGR